MSLFLVQQFSGFHHIENAVWSQPVGNLLYAAGFPKQQVCLTPLRNRSNIWFPINGFCADPGTGFKSFFNA